MESSGVVSSVSSAEKFFGQLSARRYRPRWGQAMFWRIIGSDLKKTYLGVLPTGYGKSDAALGAYFITRGQMRVNRMLIIVPTDTQRTQYVQDLTASALNLGGNLRSFQDERTGATSVARMIRHEPSDLRLAWENRCEIFVTTVQSVLSSDFFYSELMQKGRWLTFFDEYHKLNRNETAKWGRAALGVQGDIVVGLTATPIRSDNSPTIFDGMPVDVTVSFEKAYEEKAIRGVVAHIEHYFLDVTAKSGDEERITTESLRDVRDWDAYQKKRDLRFVNKYLCGILSVAHDCLLVKNMRHPGQHQMLVFAMGLDHAKHVSDLLNVFYGEGFSDWVGMSRSDAENDEIFRRYQENKLPCLVQVDKATEGFNNKRASVLVFLNLLRNGSIKAIQGAGRGVRRNPAIKSFVEDVCDMFASADSGASMLIQDFARLTVGSREPPEFPPEQEPGTRNGKDREPTWVSIPPFDSLVRDAEHDRSELIQITREEIKLAKTDVLNEAEKEAEKEVGRELSDDAARKIIDRVNQLFPDERIEAILRRRKAAEIAGSLPRLKALKEENTRASVERAVQLLTSNLLRRFFGDDQSMRGHVSSRVSGQWLRLGNPSVKKSLMDDLRRKHEWVEKIEHEVLVEGRRPEWLT